MDFDGGTRDLAKTIGVTQPLIYNYFPTKEDLIREVYQSVYVGRWRSEWNDLISDTTVSLKKRLVDFYIDFAEVIYSPDWLRIYLFSGLKSSTNQFNVDLLCRRTLDPPDLCGDP